ncbi:MAG: T9SS type A sorting domain-containing protein [Ignavibacteria bacterium]|nr:T9SS type A sorting domain-containing protein [Ignavibacteria bacterium]
MKKSQALIFVLTLSTLLFPQWSQTNGIKGGYFQSVVSTGDKLITSTANGSLFVSDGSNWSSPVTGVYAASLLNENSTIVAVNYGFIFVSSDNGTSWVKRTIPEATNSDPVLYLGKLYVISASGDTVYTSSDLGNSWLPVSLNKNFTHNNETRQIFIVMNLFVSSGKMWIEAFTDNTPESVVLLESTDQGQNWNVAFVPQNGEKTTSVANEDGVEILTTNANVYKKDISGSWALLKNGLDLGSGSTIPFNGLKLISGDYYLSVIGDNPGLFRLTGSFWVSLNSPSYINGYTMHQGSIVAATSGKIIRRVDGHWLSMTENLIASTAAPIVMSEDVVFSQYGSTLYRTTNGGNNWDSISAYIGNPVFKGNQIYGWNANGVIRSNDLGNTWTTLNSGIPQSYITKVYGVAVSGNTIYAGFHGTRRRDHLPPVWEQGGVYRSTDNGATWSSFSAGIVQEAGVPAPVYEIKASDSRVIVKTIEGTYTLNGQTWQRINSNMPASTSFTSLTVVADSIIAGSNHGLMISTNNGIDWKYFKNGLPTSQFDLYFIKYFRYLGHFFAYDSQVNKMYRLRDTTWVPSLFNLPDGMEITALDASGDVLYAGTVDRGIWKYLKTPTPVEMEENSPVSFTLSQNYPNPFNPSTTISFSLANDGFVSVKIFNILGELVAEPLSGQLAAGNHKINFDASNLQSGVYIYSVTQNGNSLSRKMTLLK